MDIIKDTDLGSFLPLLVRANAAAKALSQRRYDQEEHWRAEVKILLKHGLTNAERISNRYGQTEIPSERFTIEVRISAFLSGRYFTLEEAELIIQNLEKRS